jgi:hypothetical protein
VEVCVGPDLGTLRVAPVMNGTASGRMISPKTAGSEVLGGIVGELHLLEVRYDGQAAACLGLAGQRLLLLL